MIKGIRWNNLEERFDVISKVYNMSKHIFYDKLDNVINNEDSLNQLFNFIKNHEIYGLVLKERPFRAYSKKGLVEMVEKRKDLGQLQKIVLYYYFEEDLT